jgi:hypothetical protein
VNDDLDRAVTEICQLVDERRVPARRRHGGGPARH